MLRILETFCKSRPKDSENNVPTFDQVYPLQENHGLVHDSKESPMDHNVSASESVGLESEILSETMNDEIKTTSLAADVDIQGSQTEEMDAACLITRNSNDNNTETNKAASVEYYDDGEVEDRVCSDMNPNKKATMSSLSPSELDKTACYPSLNPSAGSDLDNDSSEDHRKSSTEKLPEDCAVYGQDSDQCKNEYLDSQRCAENDEDNVVPFGPVEDLNNKLGVKELPPSATNFQAKFTYEKDKTQLSLVDELN